MHAQPSGLEVVAGSANAPVTTDSGKYLIETQGKTILQWDQFSIGALESVRFDQAGVGAAVLNRVIGTEQSQILGSLSSNGAVYLLNPNGIFIGPHAVIQSAGFIASTFDVSNIDFLEGRSLEFTGNSPETIRNEGTIVSLDGPVLLMAHQVENTGVIQSAQKDVYQPEGMPHLFFRADNRVKPTEATATRVQGNQVYLVADGLCEQSGSIKAPGGEVQILGDRVHVLDGANVDVSGPDKGGVILVGGDYQGNNPDVKNAKVTWVGPETSLKADATENGDGGKVILWGDEGTFHAGTISARGGPDGGNGGFVEISGAYLEPKGIVNTSAPRGMTGTLLFDPTDITISTGVDSSGSFSGCPATFTPTAGTSTINTTTLANQLNTPCNVTISTVSAFAGNGDITVSNALSWSAATTLTLTAERKITLNANVTNSGTGSFTALSCTASGDSIFTGGNITTASGAISFASALMLTGDVTFTSASGTITFGGTVNGSHALNVTAGALIFGNSVGAITPLSSIVVDAPSISIRGNHIVNQGPMTYGGPVTITQGTTFSDTGTHGITFTSSVGSGLGVTVGGIGGNFSVMLSASSSNILVQGNINTTASGADGKAVQIRALNDITIQGDITANGGTASGGVGFDGGDVQITSTQGNITVQSINASGSGGTTVGGSAGGIILQTGTGLTSTSLGNLPNGKIILSKSPTTQLLSNGGAGTVPGTGSLIALAAATRGSGLSVASITSSLAGNDVVIEGSSFSVGANEVITILGSLTIDMSSSLRIGDVVVRDSYTIGSTSVVGFPISINTHGNITILNDQGTFDISPSAHFTYRTSGTILGNVTPAGSLNQGPVSGLSQSQFQAKLIHSPSSLILNFDTASTPLLAPISTPLQNSVINPFVVANSEMFYLFQYWPMSWFHQPSICFKDRVCVQTFPHFSSWLPYNDVQ